MCAWFERFDEQVSELLPQLSVLREEPMRAHTTFRIGGNARRVAQVTSCAELMQLLDLAYREQYPYLLVGNGSNLLVSDDGIDALVILTTGLQRMELIGENTLYAEAGCSLAQ